jgi:hypothetical protein
VVAAPYIETAIAFGASSGLSEDWTRQLLRFAPPADVRARSDERKIDKPWTRRTDRGFPEYGAMMLDASAPRKLTKGARHEMMRRLDQRRGRKIFTLSDKGLDAVAKAITDNRQGAPPRSASPPRNGRR